MLQRCFVANAVLISWHFPFKISSPMMTSPAVLASRTFRNFSSMSLHAHTRNRAQRSKTNRTYFSAEETARLYTNNAFSNDLTQRRQLRPQSLSWAAVVSVSASKRAGNTRKSDVLKIFPWGITTTLGTSTPRCRRLT